MSKTEVEAETDSLSQGGLETGWPVIFVGVGGGGVSVFKHVGRLPYTTRFLAPGHGGTEIAVQTFAP